MLRAVQRERIMKMLQPKNVPFKILILDEEAQAILGPLLKVSDLRTAGVTAHFPLGMDRSPIGDIPAVYFVMSTEKLAEEVARSLYQLYYINVASSFTRTAIERLAQETSEKRMAQKIQCVTDQFISFVALQDDLFSLNIRDSYLNAGDPAVMRKAVTGLISLFFSLQELPFIVNLPVLAFKTQGDGPRELDGAGELAKMLNQKICNTKIIRPGVKKPLLIILHREFDLIAPVVHVMGYVELVHDTLGIHGNKVEIEEAGQRSVYDIDTDSDFFKANRFQDFPSVADMVDKELHAYKKEMALRSITDKSDKAAIDRALEGVPHLQKKNAIINSHLNICMKTLDAVKRRRLDDFYKMGQEFDRNELMELSEKGETEDLLRLCFSLLNTKNADLIGPLLEKRGADPAILSYVAARQPAEQGIRDKLKNLLFKKSSPIVARVEEVLDATKNQRLGSFECYDPGSSGLFLSEISKIVVYVHGGVTYSELRALKGLETTYRVPVLVGGSETLNASEFLNQLKKVALERKSE